MLTLRQSQTHTLSFYLSCRLRKITLLEEEDLIMLEWLPNTPTASGASLYGSCQCDLHLVKMDTANMSAEQH